jgi:hypothetical protein
MSISCEIFDVDKSGVPRQMDEAATKGQAIRVVKQRIEVFRCTLGWVL